MAFKTIIEPFRIKSVEPITLSTPSERKIYLKDAFYNPFLLHSDQVIIDLLTDSGTSAMSAGQWAGMMDADESYAGAKSWFKLEKEIKDLTGFSHILPTHQGRAAERILYSQIGGPGKIFLSNTHFDTTRANIEYSEAAAIDCLIPESEHEKFRGNIDIAMVENLIHKNGRENFAAIILTVTNNSGGGQPVSMQNAKDLHRVCKKNHIPFILDCCRIAENSWFIKHNEPGYESLTYREIAQEMLRLADGCIMSAKKDGLVNMGGFLALKDDDLADACTQLLIITEGFTTYGGLSGRDMEAMAIGLTEIFDPGYLNYRIKSTAYLGEHLFAKGIPVIMPPGGHAVYIDAKKLYPQIPVAQYPGQSLVCELYKSGGLRCVEVGSVMFGRYDEKGKLIPAPREWVRLAIPRRVYTQSHIDYAIEVFEEVFANKEEAKGLRIIKEPKFLRHFTAHFEPIL